MKIRKLIAIVLSATLLWNETGQATVFQPSTLAAFVHTDLFTTEAFSPRAVYERILWAPKSDRARALFAFTALSVALLASFHHGGNQEVLKAGSEAVALVGAGLRLWLARRAEIPTILLARLGHASSFPIEPFPHLSYWTQLISKEFPGTQPALERISELLFHNPPGPIDEDNNLSLADLHNRAIANLAIGAIDVRGMDGLGDRFQEVVDLLTMIEPYLESAVERKLRSLPAEGSARREIDRRRIWRQRQEALLPLYMLWALRGIYGQSADIARGIIRPGGTRINEVLSSINMHLQPLVAKGRMTPFRINSQYASYPAVLHLNFEDSTTLLSNLIANAASHGKPSGGMVNIHVRLRKEGGHYILEVENLFDPNESRSTSARHYRIGLREIDILCRLHGFEKQIEMTDNSYLVRITMPARPRIPQPQWQYYLLESQRAFLAVSTFQKFEPDIFAALEPETPSGLLTLGRQVDRFLPLEGGSTTERINVVLRRTFQKLEEFLVSHLSVAPESRLELHEALLDVARMALEDIQALGVSAFNLDSMQVWALGMAQVSERLTENYRGQAEYPLLLADLEEIGYALNQAIQGTAPAVRPVLESSDKLGSVYAEVLRDIRALIAESSDFAPHTMKKDEFERLYEALPQNLEPDQELTGTLYKATQLLEQVRTWERLEKCLILLESFPGLADVVQADMNRYRPAGAPQETRTRDILDFTARALVSGDLAGMRRIDETLSNILTLMANAALRDVFMTAAYLSRKPLAPDLQGKKDQWLGEGPASLVFDLTARGGSPLEFVRRSRNLRSQSLILRRLDQVDQWLSGPMDAAEPRKSAAYKALQERRKRFFEENDGALEVASLTLYENTAALLNPTIQTLSMRQDSQAAPSHSASSPDQTDSAVKLLEPLTESIGQAARRGPDNVRQGPGARGTEVWSTHIHNLNADLRAALEKVRSEIDWTRVRQDVFAEKWKGIISYCNLLLKQAWDLYIRDNPLVLFANPNIVPLYLSTDLNDYLAPPSKPKRTRKRKMPPGAISTAIFTAIFLSALVARWMEPTGAARTSIAELSST